MVESLMGDLPICSLGDVLFSLDTAAIEQIQRTWKFNITKSQTQEGVKASYVSKGERTITIPATVYQGYIGRANVVEQLVSLAEDGKSLVLMVNHRSMSGILGNALEVGRAVGRGVLEDVISGQKRAISGVKNYVSDGLDAEGKTRLYGRWFLEDISDVAQEFDAMSQARRISFTLRLTWAGDAEIGDYKAKTSQLAEKSISRIFGGLFT